MKTRVTLIKGDGIGPEVTGATCRILAAADVPIEWEEALGGGEAVKRFGVPMPKETLDSIRSTRLGLKGPLMTPKGKGFGSANVTLRKGLQLFCGYRPVRSLPGIQTPFKNIDLVVLRENTEDLYAGIEHEVSPGTVMSLKVSTVAAADRIAAWAYEHMRHTGRRRITCCHKASIMPLADGAFVDAFYRVGADYPFIKKDDLPVDNLAFQLAQDPNQFDTLLLQNLYGDILSDLAAGLVGGLGVAPGANIGDRMAVFEAVHGTAPDIAGQDKANPLSVLLSALLLLEYIGETRLVERIERAIFDVLEAGQTLTGDLGGRASTTQFTDAIIDKL